MCSGITAYSALKKVKDNVKNGGKVVIIGCGGVGLQVSTRYISFTTEHLHLMDMICLSLSVCSSHDMSVLLHSNSFLPRLYRFTVLC